jgi:hypothetical protein
MTTPHISRPSGPHNDEAYFWTVPSGVEFKREDAPRLTRSMRTAFTDLELERLLVVYPGSRPYPIADQIHALPLGLIHDPQQRWHLG